MKKSLTIILGASITLLAACGGESTSPDNQATILAMSQHGAIADVDQEQYHSQADFQAGWDKLYAGMSDKPALPNVDFTKNTVVLFAIGEHKTAGYKARVLRALPVDNGYAVGFEVTIPGIGCHGSVNEVTRPFIVISVPTTQTVFMDEPVQRRQPDCTAN